MAIDKGCAINLILVFFSILLLKTAAAALKGKVLLLILTELCTNQSQITKI